MRGITEAGGVVGATNGMMQSHTVDVLATFLAERRNPSQVAATAVTDANTN